MKQENSSLAPPDGMRGLLSAHGGHDIFPNVGNRIDEKKLPLQPPQ